MCNNGLMTQKLSLCFITAGIAVAFVGTSFGAIKFHLNNKDHKEKAIISLLEKYAVNKQFVELNTENISYNLLHKKSFNLIFLPNKSVRVKAKYNKKTGEVQLFDALTKNPVK